MIEREGDYLNMKVNQRGNNDVKKSEIPYSKTKIKSPKLNCFRNQRNLMPKILSFYYVQKFTGGGCVPLS